MSLQTSIRKFFTLKEANQALILVKPIVKDILNIVNKLNFYKTYNSPGTLLFEENSLAPHTLENTKLEVLQGKLLYHINELQSLNVFLKDLQHGVVDFPAKLDNDIIYFCWKNGEDQIYFYHDKTCSPTQRIYLKNTPLFSEDNITS